MARPVKKPPFAIRRQLWSCYRILRRSGLSIESSLSLLSSKEYPRWHGRLSNKIYKKKAGGHKSYFTRSENAMFIYTWLKSMGLSGKKAYAFIEITINVRESALKRTLRRVRAMDSIPEPYDNASHQLLEIIALYLLRKYKLVIKKNLGKDKQELTLQIQNFATPEITKKLIEIII